MSLSRFKLYDTATHCLSFTGSKVLCTLFILLQVGFDDLQSAVIHGLILIFVFSTSTNMNLSNQCNLCFHHLQSRFEATDIWW